MAEGEAVESGEPALLPDITSDGDVILLVGPRKTKLRVYSRSLRLASNVLAAMLEPDWHEGEAISVALPREFALPGDNEEAMHVICALLHHRNDIVQCPLKEHDPLKIAILVDKYKLGFALKYVGAQWLSQPYQNSSALGQVYLMAAASLFENAEAFRDASKKIIFDCPDPYLDLWKDATVKEVFTCELFRKYCGLSP
jgi:hypothetical protein